MPVQENHRGVLVYVGDLVDFSVARQPASVIAICIQIDEWSISSVVESTANEAAQITARCCTLN